MQESWANETGETERFRRESAGPRMITRGYRVSFLTRGRRAKLADSGAASAKLGPLSNPPGANREERQQCFGQE